MMSHWKLALLVGFVLVVLLPVAGYVYERMGERRDLVRQPPPGRMVRVGTHRLHLLAKGDGKSGPTVVIEQGAGELSRFWWKLQDEIATSARVTTYDRAGYAWSEPAPEPRTSLRTGPYTIDDRAEDLHTLLETAEVPGPYLFVAHSYGGLIVRNFAEAHPGEVAGLILVDTPEESSIFNPAVLSFYDKIYWMNRAMTVAARFGLLRLLRHWVPLDRYGMWLTRPSEYSALCDDLKSLQLVPDAQRSSRAPASLSALPVIVITHGQPFPGPFAVLETNWSEGQRRLAALSSNGQLVVSAKSNHMIQNDDPELILAAIRSMMEGFHKSASLTQPMTSQPELK